MKYRIGDVSRILKISDQMIRYYEKCGILKPERSGDGRYRYYTEMDIFMLFEAMRYNQWGISLNEVGGMLSEDYYVRFEEKIADYQKQLESEVHCKQLLARRLKRYSDRLRRCRYNVGNIWVDIFPASYLFYLGNSQGDTYSISSLSDEMADIIYAPEYISFFEAYGEFEGENGEWWFIIRKEYFDALGLVPKGKYRVIEEHMALTSIADMGEIGEFTGVQNSLFTDYADTHGLKITGSLSGTLCGRGSGSERFERLLELHMPIQSL